jgi:hypothetical protein
MPHRIYQACLKTGIVSNTVYCQMAICEKLARDLDLDLDELIKTLPRAKTSSKHLWDPDGTQPGKQYGAMGRVRYGMANTDEEVS